MYEMDTNRIHPVAIQGYDKTERQEYNKRVWNILKDFVAF
jgi:hypothetical protein